MDTLRYEREHPVLTPIQIIKSPTARKRVLIGMSAGPFSCIAGNIIASYYLGAELDSAGITEPLPQLQANVVLNVWCLAACLFGYVIRNFSVNFRMSLSIGTADRDHSYHRSHTNSHIQNCRTHLCAKWGRKPTALLTECLLVICLFIIGGLTKLVTDQGDNASQSLKLGDVAVMFLFQGFYSIAWTPLLYLYPAEVMNYSIRANGVAFSQFMLNAFA